MTAVRRGWVVVLACGALGGGLPAPAAADDFPPITFDGPVTPAPRLVLTPWIGYGTAALTEFRDAMGVTGNALRGGVTVGLDGGWKPVPAVTALVRVGWMSAGESRTVAHEVTDVDYGALGTWHLVDDRRDRIAASAILVALGGRYDQVLQGVIEVSEGLLVGAGFGRLGFTSDDRHESSGTGIFASAPSSVTRGTIPLWGVGPLGEAEFGVAWRFGDHVTAGAAAGYRYLMIRKMMVSSAVDLTGDGIADSKAGTVLEDVAGSPIPLDFSGTTLVARVGLAFAGGPARRVDGFGGAATGVRQGPDGLPAEGRSRGGDVAATPDAAATPVARGGGLPGLVVAPWVGYGTVGMSRVNEIWTGSFDADVAQDKANGWRVDEAVAKRFSAGPALGIEILRPLGPDWQAGVRAGYVSAGTSSITYRASRTVDYGAFGLILTTIDQRDVLTAFALPVMAGGRWTHEVMPEVGVTAGLFAGAAYGRMTDGVNFATVTTGTGLFGSGSSTTRGTIPYAGTGAAGEALVGVAYRASARLAMGLEAGYRYLVVPKIKTVAGVDLNGDGKPDTESGRVVEDADGHSIPLDFGGFAGSVRLSLDF